MHDDELRAVKRLVRKFARELHGKGPSVQGAVLCDLVAMWLAGYTPQLREDMLASWLVTARLLVEPNEKMMFGEGGHPGGRH